MLKNISIRKYQLQLALILARGFKAEELEQIKIPETIHNISCEYKFGSKTFRIDDSYIDTHYIKIIINDKTELDCVKDPNSIQALEYILSKAANYRNYGNIEADIIIEIDVYNTFSKAITKYIDFDTLIKLEYILLNYSQSNIIDYFKNKVYLTYNNAYFRLLSDERYGMLKLIVGDDDIGEDYFYFRDSKVGRAKIVNILHKAKNIIIESRAS